MRRLFFVLLLTSLVLTSLAAWAQDSSSLPSAPEPQSPPPASSSNAPESKAPDPAAKPANPRIPDLTPPQSDRISAGSIEEGESSSKDTQVDLSPPPGDEKAHPEGSDATFDADAPPNAGGDVGEFHPWNPHKAAKDVEVGDFYFKRKNYAAAEDRYREALYYKNNDAVATFRLAVCLEKLKRPADARQEYESYLRILPYGPEAGAARKAVERLKAVDAKPAK